MIIIPAQITGFQILKDNTAKVTLNTNELNPEQTLGVVGLTNKFCYTAFKEEPFKNEESRLLDSLETDFDDPKKTPSKRLRGVLYRCYEKEPKDFGKFGDYYVHHMEKLIDHFKAKLD